MFKDYNMNQLILPLGLDVEPVFGFLSFPRFSVRGKSKAENEIGLALMAVNLRKYAVRG